MSKVNELNSMCLVTRLRLAAALAVHMGSATEEVRHFLGLLLDAGNEAVGELRERNGRLHQKNRNYRLQLKQLNRAHVVQKRLYEQLKEKHDSGAAMQLDSINLETILSAPVHKLDL